jgi:hypothetical protein
LVVDVHLKSAFAHVHVTELKGALERNHLREGKACIPEVGIRATAQKFEPPHYAEGFDALYKVRILGRGEFSISPIQI